MRMFVVFELGHYVVEAKIIGDALKASIRKVIIFLSTFVLYLLHCWASPDIQCFVAGRTFCCDRLCQVLWLSSERVLVV